MRDSSSGIVEQLLTGQASLARCVVLQLRDGTIIGLSDHDETLLRTVGGHSVHLRPDAGILVGDIQLSLSLTSGNTQLTCPLGDLVKRNQVAGRRFNHATVWIFDTDWSGTSDEVMPILKGLIADSKVAEGAAVFEIRDNNDFWNVTVGGVLTPRCRADFGDDKCGAAREEYTATVTAVASTMMFSTSLAGLKPDQYFRYGDVVFTSGELEGVWPFEIVSYLGAIGQVELLVALPTDPAIGDTLFVHNGCSRLKTSSDPTIPTCFTHGNVPRFRGFDQVPGSDNFLKVGVPGN